MTCSPSSWSGCSLQRDGEVGQDPEGANPQHAGPLGQVPLSQELPKRILGQAGASLLSLPHTPPPAAVLPRQGCEGHPSNSQVRVVMQ